MFCYAVLGAAAQPTSFDPKLIQQLDTTKSEEKKDDGPSVLTVIVGASVIGLALWALSS